MTYNSRIKPLLILIVCICLFAGASCVHAADIDDAQASNQTCIDAASDMSAMAVDTGGSIPTNNISESSNVTHFSDDCKKSDHDIHGNDYERHISPFLMAHEEDSDAHVNPALMFCGDDSDNQLLTFCGGSSDNQLLTFCGGSSDNRLSSILIDYLDNSDMGLESVLRVYGDSFDKSFKSILGVHGSDCEKHIKSNPNFHKIHACGEKIKLSSKRPQHDISPDHEILKCAELAPGIVFVDAIGTPMVDATIKTDFAACLRANSTGPSEKETGHDCGQSGQSECFCREHENCSYAVEMAGSNVVVSEFDDDSTCCCNDYCAQFNTVVGEETASSRSRNSKGQDTFQSVDGGYAVPSNLNFEGGFAMDLADLLYGNPSRFESNGLNIDDEYPQADIVDYNMEYYIFTNPDIIIEKANVNVLPKYQTKTIPYTNHCLNDLDANSTKLNLHNFNIELSLGYCITDDNYSPIETTLFMLTKACKSDLPFVGQMEFSFYDISGGIARCIF